MIFLYMCLVVLLAAPVFGSENDEEGIGALETLVGFALDGLTDNTATNLIPGNSWFGVSRRSAKQVGESFLKRYAPNCAGGALPRTRTDSPDCTSEQLEHALRAASSHYIVGFWSRIKTFAASFIPGVGIVRNTYQKLRFFAAAAHIFGLDLGASGVRSLVTGLGFDLNVKNQIAKSGKALIIKTLQSAGIRAIMKEGAKRIAGSFFPFLGILNSTLSLVWPSYEPFTRALEAFT
jgi:hypothetical protein